MMIFVGLVSLGLTTSTLMVIILAYDLRIDGFKVLFHSFHLYHFLLFSFLLFLWCSWSLGEMASVAFYILDGDDKAWSLISVVAISLGIQWLLFITSWIKYLVLHHATVIVMFGFTISFIHDQYSFHVFLLISFSKFHNPVPLVIFSSVNTDHDTNMGGSHSDSGNSYTFASVCPRH